MSDLSALLSKLGAAESRLTEASMALAEALAVPMDARDADLIADREQLFSTALKRLLAAVKPLEATLGEIETPDRAARKAVATAKAARRRLKLGRRILAELNAQREAAPQPMLFERPLRNSPDAKVWQVAEALHGVLHHYARPFQSADAEAHGCFPDIALRFELFVQYMQVAYRATLALRRSAPLRFLDVGCGTGVKLAIAAQYFTEADGLEYDPAYVDAGTRMLDLAGERRCRIHHGDALTWETYGDYDVIYFYQPIRDDAKLRQMEARILEQVRPGTVLVTPYAHSAPDWSKLDVHTITKDVHLAKVGAEEGARIEDAILRTGFEVAHPAARPPRDLAGLAPMLEALRWGGGLP